MRVCIPAIPVFSVLIIIALQVSVCFGGECDCDFHSSTVTSVPPSYTFGIVLVQFSDWTTNPDAQGGLCLAHSGQGNHYKWLEFKRAFFTQDTYVSPARYTHDGEEIFGSLRDYFNEVSYNKFDVVKHPAKPELLNDSTSAGFVEWITLHQTKSWWGNQSRNPKRLLDSAYVAAQKSGNPIDTVGYKKFAVIYAGVELAGGGLNPAASGAPGLVYQAGEKTGDHRGRTQTTGTFYGIGTHCHEFAHLIGMDDLRYTTDQDHPRGLSEFSLMSSGNQGFMNGDYADATTGGFHAPVHPDAWHKLKLGWAKYKQLPGGNFTFKSFEAEDSIAVYFIDDQNPDNWSDGESFLIENARPAFVSGGRTFDGDMQHSGVVGGLVLLHFAYGRVFTNSLNIEVKEADGSDEVGTSVGVACLDHIFPGATNNTNLNISSNPPSNDSYGNPTGLCLTNIVNNNGTVSTNIDFKIASQSSQATAYNNARKLIKVQSGGSVSYHLVYESGGEIYYTKSNDDGVSWGRTYTDRKRLSTFLGNNKYPSIAERSGNLYVVWQRYAVDHYAVYFRKSTDNGATWSAVTTISSNLGSNTPLPIIASPAANELMIVCRFINDLYWKRSIDNGSTWPYTGIISLSSASLNSPSLTASRLPYSTNVTGLAYATQEIPNASHIIARYFYNGSWSTANNISSSLPGNLSQHSHPSVSHSGDASQDYQHVAWDAYDSNYQSRVIIHRKGNVWTFGSQYWELHYQEEDRPSISGLAGTAAHMVYNRGSQNHFNAHFNGTGWTVQYPTVAGSSPSLSTGSTTAKYAWTSGTSSPYNVNVSTGSISKAVAGNDAEGSALSVAYSRSAAVVDTTSGAWLDVRIENISVKEKTQNVSELPFVDLPENVTLTSTEVFQGLDSQASLVSATAEALNIHYSITAEKLDAIKSKAEPVQITLLIGDQAGKTAIYKIFTANAERLDKTDLNVSIPLKDFVGKEITLKTQVSGISTKSGLVASLGHIYHFTDPKQPKSTSGPGITLAIVPAPEKFTLGVYPNPFNPSTSIRFTLPEEGNISLWVYNIQGQRVRKLIEEYRTAGEYTLQWDGKDDLANNAASGAYLLSLETPSKKLTNKMLLLR
jgi:M6 family metalloprotease-like protein